MQSSLKKNELFSPTSDLITKPVLEAETKLKEKEAQLTLLISAVEREKQKLDLIRAEVAAEVKRGTEYEAAMLETQTKWNDIIKKARAQRDKYVSEAEEAKSKVASFERKANVNKAQALIEKRDARLATPIKNDTNDQKTEKK